MMKLTYYLLTLSFIFYSMNTIVGQSPTVQWANKVGSSGNDTGFCVAADNNGNVYTVGIFQGALLIETTTGQVELASNGSTEAYIQKQNSAGDVIWAKSFGGNGRDYLESVHVGSDGSIYAAGSFENSVTIPTQSGVTNLNSLGLSDFLFLKFDNDGEVIWAKGYGGSGFDEINSIKTDSNGNLFAAGRFSATISINGPAGNIDITSDGATDGINVKLNASGDILWMTGFGQSDQDSSEGIDIDGNGNVYSTGYFQGTISFQVNSNTVELTSIGENDILLLKQNNNGEVLWAKRIGGDDFDYGSEVAVDAAGNIHLIGFFRGSLNAGPEYEFQSNGMADVLIAKFNSDGEIEWANSFGSSGEDFGNSIALDAAGNVYTTGLFEQIITLGSGSNQITLFSSGQQDAFIYQQDSNGNPVYGTNLGNAFYASGNSIDVNANNNIFVIGGFGVEIDFGPPAGVLSANGGLDVFTVQLGECENKTSTDVQIACEEYMWIDGNTYRSDNNSANFLLETTLGCDSLVTLNLTINDNKTSTDVVEACKEYTWIDGVTYTSSNTTATYLLETTAGCDSLVNLDLTIANVTTGTDVVTACGDYLWIDGNTYFEDNNSATFTIEGGSEAGCDSLVLLDLTISEAKVGFDLHTVCDALVWIDGNEYTEDNNSATFTITQGASNGCDSIVILDLTVVGNTTGTDTQQACVSYRWIDGQVYTENNNDAMFTIEGGNEFGCDSIVTLDLTIVDMVQGTDVQTACNEFTWIDGITYIENNNTATYTFEGGSVNGCDSTVTLNLTIIDQINGIDTQNICNETFEWIDGNTYTSSTDSATYIIEGGSVNGCDSLVTLNLTLGQNTTGTDVQNSCESYTWIDGNIYTESNNSATFNIIGGNANGCDSLVTLDLTIGEIVNEVDEITSCGPYTWIDGNTYASSNNTATYEISGGEDGDCDSIITLNLTVNQDIIVTDSVESCDAFTWIDGMTYTESNNTASVLFEGAAANGCDSLVMLSLTINYPTFGIDYVEACDSYTWIDGNTYESDTNSETFTIVGGSVEGCDSIVTLNLTINDIARGRDTQTACNEYTWIDGNTYTENNNTARFTIENGSVNGCDSIVTLNLTINKVSDISTTVNEATITANNSNAGVTYQWLDCGNNFSKIAGATNQSYTAAVNGSYAVEITENGCTSISDCEDVMVSSTKETALLMQFEIYPNPTTEEVNILFEELQMDVEISIIGNRWKNHSAAYIQPK